MDPPVVADLRNEELVPMSVRASPDRASIEVVRIWHPTRLNPTDPTRVSNQDFVLVDGMALVIPSNFRTFTQMPSCLPDICKQDHVLETNHLPWVDQPYRVRPKSGSVRVRLQPLIESMTARTGCLPLRMP